MEKKIGEIFKCNGEWYQCVKGDMYDYCKGCPSFENLRCTTLYGNKDCWLKATCEKLEKVGEPYMLEDKKFQKYKVFKTPYIYHKIDCSWQSFSDPYYISLEIKEDMEEKKQKLDDLVGLYTSAKITYKEFDEKLKTLYADKEECKSSLKEFDLEATKAGKPVCTRGGRKARIIYFDAKGDYPIVALIETGNGEKVVQYMIDGHCTNITSQCYDDLMMLPEKKEGWVNVYKGIDGVTFSKHPYTSKDEAIKNAGIVFGRIDTIKVSWEE